MSGSAVHFIVLRLSGVRKINGRLVRQKGQKAAVESLMVSNWSFNACTLAWLLNEIQPLDWFFFSREPEAADLLCVFVRSHYEAVRNFHSAQHGKSSYSQRTISDDLQTSQLWSTFSQDLPLWRKIVDWQFVAYCFKIRKNSQILLIKKLVKIRKNSFRFLV